MLKLLLLVAYRNFYRDKLTSIIQLAGLVIGISCYLLIQHYVAYQKSYNTQFSNADIIYRVNLIRDENKPQALTPIRLSQELTSNFNEIEDATRISSASVSIRHNQNVYAERATFVDKNFFKFFDFQLTEGDLHTALNSPNGLVLHEELAIKYFGRTENIIGQPMTVNGEEYLVTGIIKKSEYPHTLPETLLLPIKSYFNLLPNLQWTEMWNFNATITFTKISDKAQVETLNTTVSDFYEQRARGLSSYKSNRVVFEPLLDVYLNNVTTRSLLPSGSQLMVNAFQITAFLILFLACVNFTNLATAAAMRRGKDVGVRKAIGASKYQLITQYLVEYLMLTFFATLIAVGVVYLSIPWFNQLMNVKLALVFDLKTVCELTAIALIVGMLAGSYPAFFLSSLSPAIVLKGIVNSSKLNILFRHSLVVLQFGVAGFLLVSSVVVNWQMNYVENMPQGYDRESVLIVNRGADIYNSFKVKAMQHPDVLSVTMSHTVPTKATRTSHIVRKSGQMDDEVWVGNNPVSYDYFSTFGIKLIAGRDFSNAFVNDAYIEDKQDNTQTRGKIIVNQTLAQTLGWTPEQAVGKTIRLGNVNEGLHDHQIIGVTEDSHYINAKNMMPPMTYVLSQEPQYLSLRWLSIRLKSNANIASVKDLEEIWLSLDTNSAFKYDWLEDLFGASYRNETLQTKLLNVFTVLAFLVTTVGLLGLAAFTTESRVKEIAIRKVLGASNSQLCFMLLNQFTVLIVLANIIALPIAYWQIQNWLNNFVYRIKLPLSAFGIGIIMSLAIAYITILSISYRAIRSKPVDALASE
ncbi:ABC transporter permease [Colwelliaceae bacterium 6471]